MASGAKYSCIRYEIAPESKEALADQVVIERSCDKIRYDSAFKSTRNNSP